MGARAIANHPHDDESKTLPRMNFHRKTWSNSRQFWHKRPLETEQNGRRRRTGAGVHGVEGLRTLLPDRTIGNVTSPSPLFWGPVCLKEWVRRNGTKRRVVEPRRRLGPVVPPVRKIASPQIDPCFAILVGRSARAIADEFLFRWQNILSHV